MVPAALAAGLIGSVLTGCPGGPVPLVGRPQLPALPVTIRLVTASAVDLAAARRLPVRVRMKRRGAVRVTVVLKSASGRSLKLGAIRSVPVQANRWATVPVPMSRAARAALSSCPGGTIETTVSNSRIGRARTTRTALHVAPPACGRFFRPTTVWNTPLPATAPLDPDSKAVTQDLLKKVAAGPRKGLPPTINTRDYTPPVYTVPKAQPRVRVTLDRPGDDRDLAAAFNFVPLPPWATPAPGTDHELVVWQPATDTLWEFWRLRRARGGWHASWGGRLDRVSTGPGHFEAPHPSWGASASSLALVGGMITPRELATGRIEHALAMGVPDPRAGAFSLPAQRTDGPSWCAHAVPEGARFRLDPALNIDTLGLHPAVATIARAAQKYGIFVRDKSASVTFYAQSSVSLPSDPYPALFGGRPPYDLLASFPWSRLQLVQLQLVKTAETSPLQGLIQQCG